MKLEEVVKILSKSKIKAGDGKKEGKYPLYRSSNKIDTYYDEYLLDEEAIVVGTGGNPSIHYNTGKCAYTTQCLVITSKGTLKNKYIYYYLISQLDRIQNMFRGMTIKQLDKKEFFKMDIPIIEVDIQDKIIENLDIITNNIQSKKEQLKKLEQLVKSQFVEMFGDIHLNDKKWKEDILKNNISIIGGYAFKSSGFQKSGIPILRIGNINTGKFRDKDLKFWKEDKLLEKYAIYPKDVLISLTGTVGKEDYGNVCIIGNEYPKYYLNQRNAKLNIESMLSKEYFSYALKEAGIKKRLLRVNRGVRQANISNKDIEELKLPVPPIDLQNQFSKIVKQIDKQKFEIEKSLKETQELYESLMQEYYKQINAGIENNTGEIIKKM